MYKIKRDARAKAEERYKEGKLFHDGGGERRDSLDEEREREDHHEFLLDMERESLKRGRLWDEHYYCTYTSQDNTENKQAHIHTCTQTYCTHTHRRARTFLTHTNMTQDTTQAQDFGGLGTGGIRVCSLQGL